MKEADPDSVTAVEPASFSGRGWSDARTRRELINQSQSASEGALAAANQGVWGPRQQINTAPALKASVMTVIKLTFLSLPHGEPTRDD